MIRHEFRLSIELACRWWNRKDLEDQPANIHRVAQVLESAGIEVYEISPDDGWLSCEPRPHGVREALSGNLSIYTDNMFDGYPPEIPGSVLRRLTEMGISVGIDPHRQTC